MEYFYFNKEIEPLSYKQWLRTIRYLKDTDLYNEFINRTCLYTKRYPHETNGQFGVIPFMNRFTAKQCLQWIRNGMSMSIEEVRPKYERFNTSIAFNFLKDMEKGDYYEL